MNAPCTLCGSSHWPVKNDPCPLCRADDEYDHDYDDDKDHDSNDETTYQEDP